MELLTVSMIEEVLEKTSSSVIAPKNNKYCMVVPPRNQAIMVMIWAKERWKEEYRRQRIIKRVRIEELSE